MGSVSVLIPDFVGLSVREKSALDRSPGGLSPGAAGATRYRFRRLRLRGTAALQRLCERLSGGGTWLRGTERREDRKQESEVRRTANPKPGTPNSEPRTPNPEPWTAAQAGVFNSERIAN